MHILKTVWKIEKGRKASYLIGAAHFFPYSFKKSLTRYISNADTVLLEGPLDENNMNKVVEQGARGDNHSSLDNLLDAHTINEINRLESTISAQSYFDTYMMTFGQTRNDSLYQQIKDKKPWMAFFAIWIYCRKKNGWRYTLDIDALNIAMGLGKKVYFLEKIEEQIAALEEIPLKRIVSFLKKTGEWEGYAKRYVKYYLRGNLEGLLSGANDFPTYCESIIDKRDPVLYERMTPFIEKGNTVAVVGVTHINGIRKMLLKDGYTVNVLA
ncbi:MAG: TraB/GumN family protein [Nitrospirae bacterium]|nr:TraB/GumN family protein [Nitrospirota bacterium]